MLSAIHEAFAAVTDQVADQVTDQVAALLSKLKDGELGAAALMRELGLTHRPTFRKNYLHPALEANWIEQTQPESPTSPTQRYRLTAKGRSWTRMRS